MAVDDCAIELQRHQAQLLQVLLSSMLYREDDDDQD